MNRVVETCRSDDSLARAAGTDVGPRHRCLPIVDEDEHVVGVTTDRDICMAGSTQEQPLAKLPLRGWS